MQCTQSKANCIPTIIISFWNEHRSVASTPQMTYKEEFDLTYIITSLTSTLNASGPIAVIGLSDNILKKVKDKCDI